MSSSKMRSHFTKENKLDKKESGGTTAHVTSKVKKTIPGSFQNVPEDQIPQKYKNHWYVKEGYVEQATELGQKATIARREVVAQEFFRLLIPGHPKTRLVVDEKKGIFYVASKQIEGCQALPYGLPLKTQGGYGHTPAEKKAFNDALRNGTYHGLGEVVIIALLMNEIDLKNGNLALDSQGRLIKFDGDWCFAYLRNQWPRTTIPLDAIDLLPFPGNYNAYNWLGIIGNGTRLPDNFLDNDISAVPSFRAEVNHALLKALLLPEDLIENFINSYISQYPTEAKIIYDEFLERRNQMKSAAFRNQNFLNYLKSDEAETQLNAYIEYLKKFKTTGKNFIFEKLVNPEEKILLQFNDLRASAFPSEDLQSPKPSGNWLKNNWKPIVSVLVVTTAIVATIVTGGIAGAIGAAIMGGALAASSTGAIAIGATMFVGGSAIASAMLYGLGKLGGLVIDKIRKAYQNYKNQNMDTVGDQSKSVDASSNDSDDHLLNDLNQHTKRSAPKNPGATNYSQISKNFQTTEYSHVHKQKM